MSDSIYIEMTDAYEVVEGIGGITVTRVFHDDGSGKSGATTLPEIGDHLGAFGTAYYSTVVIQRIKRKFGGHPDKNIWTITYGSRPSTNKNTVVVGGANTTEIPINGRISGEMVSIDGPDSGYTWADGTAIEQTVGKRIGTGSFSTVKRLKNLPLIDTCTYAGRINSDKIYLKGNTLPKETVLFEGADFREYYDEEGIRRWEITFSFSLKLITSGITLDGSDTAGGWLYLFRASSKLFEKVPGLYSTADLNKLLTIKDSE